MQLPLTASRMPHQHPRHIHTSRHPHHSSTAAPCSETILVVQPRSRPPAELAEALRLAEALGGAAPGQPPPPHMLAGSGSSLLLNKSHESCPVQRRRHATAHRAGRGERPGGHHGPGDHAPAPDAGLTHEGVAMPKVVMITGNASRPIVEASVAGGANGYFLKPIRPVKVEEFMRKLLKR